MGEINNAELLKYIAHYNISSPWRVQPMESGMNNTTRKIAASDGAYMLRIYNNHKESSIIQVEHELLMKLSAAPYDILTPVPVRNKQGETFSCLEDGTLFSLYHYIEGERPIGGHRFHIASLGKAAGKLSHQLASLKLDVEPIYDPYYKLFVSYEHLTDEEIEKLIEASDQLQERQHSIAFLMQQYAASQNWRQEIEGLPHQWIHGDIVCNNSLVRGDEVVAILDFEFVAQDVRAMEPAVIAVDLLQKPNVLSQKHEGVKLMLESFLQEVQLLTEELALMPKLMKLRLLDVFLHVVVRYQSGLSSLELLCEIIDQTIELITYIDQDEKFLGIFN